MVGNRKSLGVGLWLAAAAMALLGSAGTARAADRPTIHQRMAKHHEQWVAEGRPAAQGASLAPKWGVGNWEIFHVHAYEFQPNDNADRIKDDGNGYRYFASPTSVPYMAAPVHLPAGANIQSIGISGCFNDPTGTAVFGLWDNGVGGAGGGGGENLGGLKIATAGCGVTEYPFGPVPYGSVQDHPLYLVIMFAGTAVDGSTKFNSITVTFSRELSPAPVEATFDDVPTSDPAFQHIEALAASGITGGCGNDNYCPDNPVTRRQMAVFLAKALGLHWTSFPP